MPDYVKICPNCGGTNIGFDPIGNYTGLGFNEYCKDCQFGQKTDAWQPMRFPEILVSEVAEFRKQLASRKR